MLRLFSILVVAVLSQAGCSSIMGFDEPVLRMDDGTHADGAPAVDVSGSGGATADGCVPFAETTACAHRCAGAIASNGCGDVACGADRCASGEMCNSAHECVCRPRTKAEACAGKCAGESVTDGCGGNLVCDCEPGRVCTSAGACCIRRSEAEACAGRCAGTIVDDGCEETLTCGLDRCGVGQRCFAGACCTPTAIATACAGSCDGKAVSDGCGMELTCAGTAYCPANATCTVQSCCTPATSNQVLCSAKCGTLPDKNSCGQVVACGACGGDQTCMADNSCCARLDVAVACDGRCNGIKMSDGCSSTYPCTSTTFCEAGEVCSGTTCCKPKTAAEVCGTTYCNRNDRPDGCGGTVTCGNTCTAGAVCGGAGTAGECGKPPSCKALLASGDTQSGMKTVYPGGTATVVWCDMTTDGGGWTVIFLMSQLDYKTGIASYDFPGAYTILASATEVLIGYRDGGYVPTPGTNIARFALPFEWRAQPPFAYEQNSSDVSGFYFNGAPVSIPTKVIYGYAGWGPDCGPNTWSMVSGSMEGRVCMSSNPKESTPAAPLFAEFAIDRTSFPNPDTADNCSQGYDGFPRTLCSTGRRFSIAVR